MSAQAQHTKYTEASRQQKVARGIRHLVEPVRDMKLKLSKLIKFLAMSYFV